MTMIRPLVIFVALTLPAWAAPKEPASRPVERAVKERTGLAVRWQQDAAAREEVQAQRPALWRRCGRF